MKKQKMNKMVEICMQNKSFRESYQNKKEDPQKVTVTFLKKMEDESENIQEAFRNFKKKSDALDERLEECKQNKKNLKTKYSQ